MIEEKYKEKISKLINTFKEAEKQLKHSEHDTNELSIPSINQLRYVAFHLIESFLLSDEDTIKEEFSCSKCHLTGNGYNSIKLKGRVKTPKYSL